MTAPVSPYPVFAPAGRPIVEVDIHGTITSGGTSQSLMAAADSTHVRVGWWLQNQSSGDLWVVSSDRAATAAAAAPGIKIASGQLYECPTHMVSQGSYQIFGATTGQAWDAVQVTG